MAQIAISDLSEQKPDWFAPPVLVIQWLIKSVRKGVTFAEQYPPHNHYSCKFET